MHAGFFGDFGEREVVIVVIEEIAAVKIGDVEVHKPIVVIISRDNALGESNFVHAGGVRDVFKSAVALVAEKVARTIFVAHEQVQEAVVVDIGPDGGLRACRGFGEARFARDVGERAIAIISQQ